MIGSRRLPSLGGARELLLAIAVLTALLACLGGLSELVHRWSVQEEYSHGFFIPLISAWLFWRRRDAWKQSIGAPSPWAWAVVLAAAAMLVFGEFTAIYLLVQLAFIVALAGLILAYGGISLLRVSALPLALLLFGIPLPYFVDSQLSWRLQILSSNIGVTFLRALGYSVFREGNVIDLGSYMLQVVDACSGLRYLYPLLSVGFLMAYMYPAALRWRVLIVLSTIPVTVITNSARIAMVGILVERWGSGMAEGFMHSFEGWVIFLVCQVVLMAEIMLIERFTLRRHLLDLQQWPDVAAVLPRAPRAASRASIVGALVILGGSAVAVQTVNARVEAQPERTTLKLFPLELAGWHATESSLSAEVEQALGFRDYVLADYVGSDGKDRVNFYAAYYGSQRKGVSPHSPQVCIPGGGWVISDLQQVKVDTGAEGALNVNRVVIDKNGERALVYYWFEQRGRHIASEYGMKWYLLVDSVTRNRSDGALVRVVTSVSPNESTAAADERLRRFMVDAVPRLAAFIPK